MSDDTRYPTGQPGAAQGRWPFEPVTGATPGATGEGPAAGHGPGTPAATSWSADGPGTPAATSADGPGHIAPGGEGAGPDAPEGGGPGKRRRPPLWLLILVGVVVLGLAVALVLLLVNRNGEPVEAATVTLPVPTATIEPMERVAGTQFQDSLPSEVREWALTAIEEHLPLLIAGALEGYKLTYSDGTRELIVYAGQWRDAVGAEAAFDAIVALESQVPEAEPTPTAESTTEATESPTADPEPEPEEGIVEVDGQQVGRYSFLPRGDGTASLWWTNQSVLIQIDGPVDAVRDVFAAYPL